MHGLAALGVWLTFLVKYRMPGIAINALRISPFHLHNIMKHFEMTLKFSYLNSALESGFEHREPLTGAYILWDQI